MSAVKERRVVLDTDFIEGITSYRKGDAADLFRRVFRVLDKQPVVHPYVADNELIHDRVAQGLITSGELTVIPYHAFLPEDEVRQALYRNSFKDMHQIIVGEHIPRRGGCRMVPLAPDEDIFTGHAKRSFGEIHSILMAAELGIPLFYSNDSGARTAAGRYRAGRLIVQNAEEVAELLKEAGGSVVTGEERRFIAHYYTRNRH